MRHGAPPGAARNEVRPRRVLRLRLRYGARAHHHAAVRHPGYTPLLQQRPALPGASPMKVSVSWLRDYVDVDLSPEELARRLTLSGTKVEHVDHVGAQWRDIVVGRITRLEPHPDPNVNLQLATVSLGERGQQTVVTGAFNITVGDRVPYAGLGVTLANGVTIKSRKLRGVLSEGMILSDDELGLGEDHTGIRILDPAAPEGRPLSEVLGDAILELEITTNRPDCLSVIGIAREVAAITGQTLHLPEVRIVEGDGSAGELLSVRVEEPNLC